MFSYYFLMKKKDILGKVGSLQSSNKIKDLPQSDSDKNIYSEEIYASVNGWKKLLEWNHNILHSFYSSLNDSKNISKIRGIHTFSFLSSLHFLTFPSLLHLEEGFQPSMPGKESRAEGRPQTSVQGWFGVTKEKEKQDLFNSSLFVKAL